MLNEKPFINIAHGFNNTRIYKADGELFSYTATIESIIPFSTKSIYDMTEHIMKQIKGLESDVNLLFCYPRGYVKPRSNKKKKLNKLLDLGRCDITFNLMSRWITMLL